ncbi:MAG: Crp/Fnr family transcriptional regulator, partial [Chloroflexota bacterium]
MLDEAQVARVAQVLPLLLADPPLARELTRTAYFVRVPAGRDVFAIGDRVDAIALLVSGTVRVYKMSDTGREITLYRFSGGESCILTANAIMSEVVFPAIATVEADAEAVMVSADAFREWVGRYGPWRDFVFDLLSQRLVSVMEIVDEVTFGRLDSRVAVLLLRKGAGRTTLKITHAEIAAELGSSREVITRVLS